MIQSANKEGAQMGQQGHTPGPWKANFRLGPQFAIEGWQIKADHGAETPIASLWKGGGTHGKQTQEANARLIAACPKMYDYVTMRAKGGDKVAQEIMRDVSA